MSRVLEKIAKRHRGMAEAMHKESFILAFEEVEGDANVAEVLSEGEDLMLVDDSVKLVDEEGPDVLDEEDGLPANLRAQVFQNHLRSIF